MPAGGHSVSGTNGPKPSGVAPDAHLQVVKTQVERRIAHLDLVWVSGARNRRV